MQIIIKEWFKQKDPFPKHTFLESSWKPKECVCRGTSVFTLWSAEIFPIQQCGMQNLAD